MGKVPLELDPQEGGVDGKNPTGWGVDAKLRFG